ncbi:hypothetical protein B566_EDAN013802 [Ephemera danica]|nr:hypothetical protein B566_EDAN013802 [Ephemera danica]
MCVGTLTTPIMTSTSSATIAATSTTTGRGTRRHSLTPDILKLKLAGATRREDTANTSGTTTMTATTRATTVDTLEVAATRNFYSSSQPFLFVNCV